MYKDEGIVLNNDWINQHSQWCKYDNSNLQQDTVDETSDNEEIIHNEIPQDESESTAGVTDTMFTATDFLEDEERQNILNIAPGEGNRPLSVFRDKYCEELAYPGIFLGQARPDNKQRLVNITYSDICLTVISVNQNWDNLIEELQCALKIYFTKQKSCKWKSY